MSRPVSETLKYFPLDVDMFDDPKLLFVSERFDEKGEIITIKLMCWIYRNGYYCEWSDETALIFAKKNFSTIKANLCVDVVNELLKRGFFDVAIFKRFGVLTSKAIQNRWQTIMINSRRKSRVNVYYDLINEEETPPIQTLTPSEHTESTQSKRKEKKVNNNSVDEALDLFKKQIGSNESELWRESFYMKLKYKKGCLSPIVDEFIIDFKLRDHKIPKTLREFRQHLLNWVNVQDRLNKFDKYKTKSNKSLSI